MTATPRIGLAIANPMLREGIAEVLGTAGLEVVVAAGDAKGILREAKTATPEVCVVDRELTGGFLEVVEKLSGAGIAVIVLAAEEDVDELLRVVELGALGLLPHDMPVDLFPDIVRGVAGGEAAVSRRLMGRLLERLRVERRRLVIDDAGGERVELSPRELAVLELVASGASASEAGAQLGIAPTTARRHLSTAVRKLGVADRAEAIKALRFHTARH